MGQSTLASLGGHATGGCVSGGVAICCSLISPGSAPSSTGPTPSSSILPLSEAPPSELLSSRAEKDRWRFRIRLTQPGGARGETHRRCRPPPDVRQQLESRPGGWCPRPAALGFQRGPVRGERPRTLPNVPTVIPVGIQPGGGFNVRAGSPPPLPRRPRSRPAWRPRHSAASLLSRDKTSQPPHRGNDKQKGAGLLYLDKRGSRRRPPVLLPPRSSSLSARLRPHLPLLLLLLPPLPCSPPWEHLRRRTSSWSSDGGA